MEGMTWPTGWPAGGGLPPPEAPRTGAPFELIARQFGHRDVAMVAKVYGRFKSSRGQLSTRKQPIGHAAAGPP